MSAVLGINSPRPITVYHERREHACVPRRHAGRRHLPDGTHAPVQPVHKPRPVCAQSHGRKCESGSRRRFEPASAESNVDCHDIHAIAAEPDGFRSQFTFPGVGPQHGSHAIAVEIDSRPQVVMAIRLNEALRASVGSTRASFWAIQYATRVALGPGKAQRRVHGLPARVRVDREQDVRATVSQAVPIAVRPMVCSWLRRSAR